MADRIPDLNTTDAIMSKANQDFRVQSGQVVVCALSGISKRDDVIKMEAAGVRAVLVGEALMLVSMRLVLHASTYCVVVLVA